MTCGKGDQNMIGTVRRTKINSLSSNDLDNWVKEHTKDIFKELRNGLTITNILALAKIRKKLIAVLDARGLDVFKRGRKEPERIRQALATVSLKEVEATPETQRINSTRVRFQKRERERIKSKKPISKSSLYKVVK